MKIVGYLRTSLIEWPGKISSVIFVPGCNFRCPFCHNSHLVDPKEIAKLPVIPEKEILADLKKRKKWVDGVVLTGGEPCLWPDLPDFLKKVKKMGFETMIETNGSKTEVVAELLNYQIVNYFALDYKAPLGECYAQAIGLKSFDSQIWLKSLRLILKSRIPFELRTTVVPGIHDEKVLRKMAQQLKLDAKRYKLNAKFYWFLQTFQPKSCLDQEFNKLKPYSKIEMEKLLTVVKKTIPNAQIRD